jgi:hypothetical protein
MSILHLRDPHGIMSCGASMVIETIAIESARAAAEHTKKEKRKQRTRRPPATENKSLTVT